MNMKVYKKTRYQNIYRHIKNGNFVISMSKPIKTSISKIDDRKIFDIDDAIRIIDNYARNAVKAQNKLDISDFDGIWDKYIFNCKYVKKLAYNTLNRKDKVYSKYLKGKVDKRINKASEEYWLKFINDTDTTLIQKNQIIKELKALYNWCIEEDYLVNNTLLKIKKFSIARKEMKYWTPEELKQFLLCIEEDLINRNKCIRKRAYMIKILTLIGFSLGDRVGETRALTFGSFNKNLETANINHSINYDRTSDDFLDNTKTYHSQRTINITSKLINEIDKYRIFLEDEEETIINDKNLIFFNYSTMKPITDTTLRKHFYYYCDKADVTRIRMYDLRHTYVATMMSENMELYMISERIGHSSIKTTVDKYGHLSNELRKEIAKTTDKYI